MSIAAYLAKLSEGVDSSGILSASRGGTGTTSGGTFPTISAINYGGDGNDTATDTAGGKTVTLTGANFAANAKILINGVTAPVVTVVSPTTITFTTPAMAAGTYVLYMINADGSTAIAVPGISYSGVPVWSTAAGTVATAYETQAVSASLSATSNSAVTVSLLSGSLPPGAILNSNGTISGTSAIVSGPTTYTFTIRATDAELQDTDRQFSIVINPDLVTVTNPANGSTITLNQNESNTVNLTATSATGNTMSGFSASALPPGMSLNGSTVSGTPTVLGNTASTITATSNTTAKTGTSTFTWTVVVGGDAFWKNTTLLLTGTDPADNFITDYSAFNNRLTTGGNTRPNNFNPYQTGYYSTYCSTGGNYLTFPGTNILPTGTENFTVEFWFNRTNAWSVGGDFLGTSSTNNGFSIFTNTGAGTLRLSSYATVGVVDYAYANIPLGTWNHFAITRSGNNFTIWLNGQSVATATSTVSFTAPAASWIGSNGFEGNISNIRVVRGTVLYSSAFTPSTTPLTAVSGTSLLTCQNSRWIDNSLNNVVITPVNSAKIQSFNPFGVPASTTVNNLYSTYFDGTGDYLNMPSNAAFAFGTGDFTIEGWFYFTGTISTYQRPWWFGDDNDNLEIFSSVIRFGGASLTVITGTTVVANTWYHIAYSRQSGSGKLFINGTQVGATTASAYSSSARTLTLMATSSGVNPSTGLVSNFRVVKGTALYTTDFTPPTSNLTVITNTSLLTCQDATIRDNSTNAFAITSAGDARPVAQSPFTQTTTTVPLTNVGSAWFFTNGGSNNGDYIGGYTSPALGTQDHTVEFWYYNDGALQTYGNPWTYNGSATQQATNNYYLSIGAGGSGVVLGGGAGNWIINMAFTTPAINAWSHIALTRSGSTFRVFVNGVQAATATTTQAITAPNGQMLLGTYAVGAANGNWINGYISNFRYVIGTALYTANFTPPTQPLTAVPNTRLLTCQTAQPTNSISFIDNSNLSNVVARNGNVSQGTFSPYSANWSNYFPANGSYLTGSNTKLGDLATSTTPWIFECWVFPQTSATVFACGGGFTYSNAVAIQWNSGTSKFTVSQGNGSSNPVTVNTTGTYAANNWYHLAVSRTAAGTTTIYVNGVADGSQTYTAGGFAGGATTLVINGLYDNNGLGNNGGQQYLSNLRLIIGSSLSGNFSVPTAPLTATSNTVLLTCQDNRFIDNGPLNISLTPTSVPSIQRFSPFSPIIQTPQTYSTYFNATSSQWLSFPAGTNTGGDLGAGDFTLECWTYLLSRTNLYPTIFDNAGAAGNTNRLFLSAGHNSISSTNYNGYLAGTNMSFSTAVIYNAWTHLALVRSGTTIKLYVNGVADSTTYTSSTNLSGTTTAYIGGSAGDAANCSINGYINNFRIVKGTAVYSANFTPATANLTAIANTNLLTCQNATLRDNSTNAVTITSNGTAAPKNLNPFGYTNTKGQAYTPALYSGSAYFDGNGDFLTTTSPQLWTVSTGTTPLTIEAWVYPTSTAAGTVITEQWFTGQPITMTLSLGQAVGDAAVNNKVWYGYYNGSSWTGAISASILPLNAWSHIAGVFTGGQIRIYINGVLDGTPVSSTSWQTTTSNFGYIGVNWGGNAAYFSGYISDLRVLKNQAIYTSNFMPPQAPLTNNSATQLLLNFDKSGIVDHTKSVNLETIGDVKIAPESAYSGTYYSNYFDGNGDSLAINYATSSNIPGDFTWETWVYETGANAYGTLLGWRGSSAGWKGFIIQRNNSANIVASINDGGITITQTSNTFIVNQWNHVALVRSGSTVTLYVNGVNSGTATLSAAFDPGSAYWIGADPGNQVAAVYLQGYISNQRFINGTALYTTNFTPPTGPLTAVTNTRVLTCQSNRFVDTSANAFAVTRNGDVAVRSMNPWLRNTATSMYFDGSNDYLTIPGNFSALGTSDFTIEMWLYPTVYAATSAAVFDTRPAPSATQVGYQTITISSTGVLSYNTTGTISGGTVIAGSWNHVAVTKTGGSTKLFLNGTQVGSTYSDSVVYLLGANRPIIATDGNVPNSAGYSYIGYIEDLRVTRGVARYTANFTPPTAKLYNK